MRNRASSNNILNTLPSPRIGRREVGFFENCVSSILRISSFIEDFQLIGKSLFV